MEKKFLGSKIWAIDSEDYAYLFRSSDLKTPEKQLIELVHKKPEHMKGLTWRITELEALDNVVKYKHPLSREKLDESMNTERLVYPYAFIYFKDNRVVNVEFRENEIKNLKSPVIYGAYYLNDVIGETWKFKRTIISKPNT